MTAWLARLWRQLLRLVRRWPPPPWRRQGPDQRPEVRGGPGALEALLVGVEAFNAARAATGFRPLWLGDINLADQDLRAVDFRACVLVGASLRGADLRGARLADAVLRGCDLTGADLGGVDLQGVDVRELPGLTLGGPCSPRLDTNRWWRPVLPVMLQALGPAWCRKSGLARARLLLANPSAYALHLEVALADGPSKPVLLRAGEERMVMVSALAPGGGRWLEAWARVSAGDQVLASARAAVPLLKSPRFARRPHGFPARRDRLASDENAAAAHPPCGLQEQRR